MQIYGHGKSYVSGLGCRPLSIAVMKGTACDSRLKADAGAGRFQFAQICSRAAFWQSSQKPAGPAEDLWKKLSQNFGPIGLAFGLAAAEAELQEYWFNFGDAIGVVSRSSPGQPLCRVVAGVRTDTQASYIACKQKPRVALVNKIAVQWVHAGCGDHVGLLQVWVKSWVSSLWKSGVSSLGPSHGISVQDGKPPFEVKPSPSIFKEQLVKLKVWSFKSLVTVVPYKLWPYHSIPDSNHSPCRFFQDSPAWRLEPFALITFFLEAFYRAAAMNTLQLLLQQQLGGWLSLSCFGCFVYLFFRN